jgi:PAS domain S-box-containing protein
MRWKRFAVRPLFLTGTYNPAVPLLLTHTMYRWNAYALPWIVVAVALFTLAAVIFRRQRASRVAVLFCVMIVFVAAWFSSFAALLLAADESVASSWARIALAAVCFLPASVYDFTATALRLSVKRKRLVIASWSLSGVFALITLFSGAIVRTVTPHAWGFYPRAGWLFIPFLLFFFSILGVQLAEYAGEYRRTPDRVRRKRIGKLIVSFVVVYLSVVDFIPMFGINQPPLGYLPVIAFVLTAWRSIRRHRFTAITAARAAREILQTMADALFVIDADGRIRVINDAVGTLFGYTDVELLGKSIDTLEKIDGDRTISRTLRELSRRGAIRDQERIFRARDGHAIDVSVSISPVADGEVQQGAVVIARDIRERKRAEDEMRSFTKRLQQSNRELEDFAYVASHDLQEPLRKIQAFADLLKTKHGASVPPQARDYLDRMQSAAKRMQVLINDLLSFSRVTTKAKPFVPVSLGEIARDVAKDLEVRTHETGGAIVIGDLPTIDADPLQMRQLLQNLAANALKFHREGVAPVVEIAASIGNDGLCRLTVSDNGIGFEEKYAERIFTMFERLHGRAKYEGTGIGLAICRKIAQRHGGDIEARSTLGEGAAFTVTIPVRHEHERNHVDA